MKHLVVTNHTVLYSLGSSRKNTVCLLVDPGLLAAGPFANTLREPVGNFLVGRFNRVTSVADVAANLCNFRRRKGY